MIKFKQATKETDIAKISQLAYEIWRNHYYKLVGMDQTEYMLEKFQSVSALKTAIASGYEYYLIKENFVPIGYFGIKKNEPSGALFLSKLYILESARKKGYSRLVLNELEEMAKNSGLNRIWLTVYKKNVSKEIYEKIGLIQTDSIVTDIGNGYVMDDYVYSKEV